MSANVVVVSGSGRYADPWHPLAETSGRVADILRERIYSGHYPDGDRLPAERRTSRAGQASASPSHAMSSSPMAAKSP